MPHFKLEEVSPMPLVGPGLQVELPPSNVLVDAGSMWRGNSGGGSVCKHRTGVLLCQMFVVPYLPPSVSLR